MASKQYDKYIDKLHDLIFYIRSCHEINNFSGIAHLYITTTKGGGFQGYIKIKESIELFIGSVQKKEIEINYDIPDGLSVFTDLHMFESLIRNLMSNAVKFTPKKGKITVSANNIEGNFIEIAVRDTGIGMKKELMGNLFRLDEQTGRKGTEGESSAGLGLIICRDFVEKHSGRIWVESEEGKGSTFYFTLPKNR